MMVVWKHKLHNTRRIAEWGRRVYRDRGQSKTSQTVVLQLEVCQPSWQVCESLRELLKGEQPSDALGRPMVWGSSKTGFLVRSFEMRSLTLFGTQLPQCHHSSLFPSRSRSRLGRCCSSTSSYYVRLLLLVFKFSTPVPRTVVRRTIIAADLLTSCSGEPGGSESLRVPMFRFPPGNDEPRPRAPNRMSSEALSFNAHQARYVSSPATRDPPTTKQQ